MPAMDLLVRVSELAELRREQARLTGIATELREAWERDNAALLAAVRLAGQRVADAETALRAVAEQRYAETKDKQLCPGIVIKEFETLHYDADAALAWARETKMALLPESLDRRAFEKIAKAAPGVGGSSIIIEPRVQFAKDLDAALGGVALNVESPAVSQAVPEV